MADEARKRLAFKAVHSAGDYLRKMFGKKVRAKIKLDSSWVSEVDDTSENLMKKLIQIEFPEDGLLFEESPEKKAENQYRWITDPLDGTHNFLIGLYDFGCGLALEEEGNIVLGICYFPKYNQLFWAEKGKGAFCNRKPIKVSSAKELKGGVFFPDSNFRIVTQRSLEDINALVKAGCSIRIIGCSHRSLVYIASGKALIAISRSGKPWDLSPGALILKEAGGMSTDENGEIWKPGSQELIATNGFVHFKVLDLIRRRE